jgi:multidrug efflux pump subunit AcrB/ABC-type multidrug transport system ATPase subunit
MKFIINRKVLISMLFTGLTLLGFVSYRQLPVELYPNPEFPFLIVQVMAPLEVDPSYMENAAVIPLEEAVSTLEDIEEVRSEVGSRRARITVSFKKKTNFRLAYLRLQEKVNSARPSLPGNFRVMVVRIDPEEMNRRFMELQVTGEGDVNRIRALVDKKIRPSLENIDGIAGVQVYGGRERTIEVRLDEAACKAYRITPAQVRQALTKNTGTRTYAGNVYDAGKRWFVHVSSDFSDVTQIENIVVARGPVLLKDVAEVFFGLKEETSYSRVNGKNAVSVTLINDTRSNLIDLSHCTQQVIRELNRKYKSMGLEIIIQSNVAETMEKNIDQIMRLALTGGLLAILVLWLFLRNLRIVSFVALAMPISIFTAFNLFYAFNITLNSFSLIGMVLAIGMLLDNSVVVLENIYRRSAAGEPPATAVTEGTREVWRSVFAATLTTVMVFVPFLFSQNMLIRLLGREISVSIISTLLVSLAVALLFIPMTTHSVLRRQHKGGLLYEKMTTDNRIIQIYLLLLKTGLRHPAATVLGAVVLFFVTVFIVLSINVRSVNEEKSNALTINVRMAKGATLTTTDALVRNIEEVVDKMEEKKEVLGNIRVGEAVITVKLKEDYHRLTGRNIEDIVSDIRTKFRNVKNADIGVSSSMTGSGDAGGMTNNDLANFQRLLGMGGQREEIIVRGEDYPVMRRVANDLDYILGTLESVNYSWVSSPWVRPEIHLLFDPLTMTEYGVDLSSVTRALNSFTGEMSAGVTFRQGLDQYDIIIRDSRVDTVSQTSRKTLDDLRHLPVQGAAGTLHELQTFAKIVYAYGKGSIRRVNQGKQITLGYAFMPEAYRSKKLLVSYKTEVASLVHAYHLPAGVSVEIVKQEDEFKDFYFLIGAAVLLIFMILASVFESLTVPFVLMFSIPLAAIGSFLALIFTHNSLFNANTLTGFIILIGIVVNNGILLIDFTNILRRRGNRKIRALITAGISRVRPILITAITTIVAMVPLALGNAEYVSAIGAPFAITVIGGLSVSTLLTLIVIPVFYSGLENALLWIRQLPWRIQMIMGVAWVAGGILIWLQVDTFLWKTLLLILLVVGVPGITWFVLTSLRSAGMHLIPAGEPIHIVLRNVVKIYDRPGRFVRQWQAGKIMRQKAGYGKDYRKTSDFFDLIWQLPLYAFMIWFTFFYLEKKFWVILFSIVTWGITMWLYGPWQQVLRNRYADTGKRRYLRLERWLRRIFYWMLPAGILAWEILMLHTTALVVITGVLWYFALIVSAVAAKLHREKINVDRITGRFGGLRRGFYRMVKNIPVLGKKRSPFKALRGVSMEIGTGMFGLLGPNGAGKTTLMRIVCGIYDQSYGKVWINGHDTLEKREELQGYIGYLPQEFGMYENMTAWDYLDYQALLRGMTEREEREERLWYVLQAVHMLDHRDEKIGSFSGGMKQRIGIAQILLHLPRILVVDEPTAGLDPRERIRFRNLLVELSRERIVLFSTHIIEDIASSCNRVAVIDRGELKYLGDPQDMTRFGKGKVWQVEVPEEEFKKRSEEWLVVHHMQVGDRIRVRMIARKKPAPGAVGVTPLLEDAYLCLLKDIR